MKKLLQHLVFVTATVAAGSAMAGVTFWEADNFVGRPFSANGAVPDFRAYNFNDRAMSMVVEGSPVEACSDINFGGQCQVFVPGEYPSLLQHGWTHTISSVRPAGYGGYAPRGYDQRGDAPRGYDQRGYDQRGYDQRGYDQRGYGYPQGTYDQRAYQGRDRGNYQYPGDRNWNGY